MNKLTQSTSDKIFNITNLILITIITFTVFYPLYFVVIASFSNPDLVNSGQVWFWPKGITLKGYRAIFEDERVWTGYGNSLYYTIVGTAINLFVTLTIGYALSRKDFSIKNIVMVFLVITMYFQGGLIPRFILVKNLYLINTRSLMLVIHAATVYNIIITRTFFKNTIPDELLDAAVVDGCTNFQFFYKIVLPLSKAIIAVNIIFYGVGHWNRYFSAMIYLQSEKLYPLQLFLREILVKNQMDVSNAELITSEDISKAEIIRYGLILVASVPMLMLYPFVQKYFVKGVMIGSIKG